MQTSTITETDQHRRDRAEVHAADLSINDSGITYATEETHPRNHCYAGQTVASAAAWIRADRAVAKERSIGP